MMNFSAFPEIVVINIFRFMELKYLLKTICLVNKYFNFLIWESNILWRNIDFSCCEIRSLFLRKALSRDNSEIRQLVFWRALSKIPCYDIDFILTTHLSKASLIWNLDLSGCQLSTLCFLPTLTSLEILRLDDCQNLLTHDFDVLSKCPKLEQLYASRTKVEANTVINYIARDGIIVLVLSVTVKWVRGFILLIVLGLLVRK